MSSATDVALVKVNRLAYYYTSLSRHAQTEEAVVGGSPRTEDQQTKRGSDALSCDLYSRYRRNIACSEQHKGSTQFALMDAQPSHVMIDLSPQVTYQNQG